MSYEYVIDPARQLIDIRIQGRTDGRALLDILRAVVSDAQWRPNYAELWDAADVTELVLDPEHLVAFRQLQGALRAERPAFSWSEGGPAAVVATRDIVRLTAEGAVRYLRRMGRTAYVCPTRAAALQRLGVD